MRRLGAFGLASIWTIPGSPRVLMAHATLPPAPSRTGGIRLDLAINDLRPGPVNAILRGDSVVCGADGRAICVVALQPQYRYRQRHPRSPIA